MRVRLVTFDLTAFRVGGVHAIALFWARGAVASANDLSKMAEGNFAQGTNLGGQGSVLLHHTDIPIKDRKFVAVRLISIDSTDRIAPWSVTGHAD